jgi:hypothetical protein
MVFDFVCSYTDCVLKVLLYYMYGQKLVAGFIVLFCLLVRFWSLFTPPFFLSFIENLADSFLSTCRVLYTHFYQ